jgi:hypothetical protein
LEVVDARGIAGQDEAGQLQAGPGGRMEVHSDERATIEHQSAS